MKIEELIQKSNYYRKNLNLKPIELFSRPSTSSPGKTTIEVMSDGKVLAKSINGGAINWFLKGLLSAFSDKPIVVTNFNQDITHYNYQRKAKF